MPVSSRGHSKDQYSSQENQSTNDYYLLRIIGSSKVSVGMEVVERMVGENGRSDHGGDRR